MIDIEEFEAGYCMIDDTCCDNCGELIDDSEESYYNKRAELIACCVACTKALSTTDWKEKLC